MASSAMFSMKEMPSASSLFSAYASMSASIMLARSMVNQLVPQPVQGYVISAVRSLFRKRSPRQLTLVIEESSGIARNQVYDAAEVYLCTKISSKTERLRVSKSPKEKTLTVRLEKGEAMVDRFQDIELQWKFICTEIERSNRGGPSAPVTEKRFFELTFDKAHQEAVLDGYLPHVLQSAEVTANQKRALKMFTLNPAYLYGGGPKWDSVNLEHPSTFDTIALEPDLKAAILEDLDKFVRRKEFYKRVGRAWKRGYLLYGPPGTGKSSLIAAIANYLKFDVYDLQLQNVVRDSELRKLLLSTANKSILVIEDIDCSVDLPDRRGEDGHKQHEKQTQLTLSGLLNFIDGLWSSCGDERIIIFTTNHKDKLDPALLRPGRMDMHIHMSYCTYHGFKLLASNYLEICGHHRLFDEIESLLKETEVTPAQIAEELMKSEDSDIALEGVVKLLKRKMMEDDEEDEAENKARGRETKRQKVEPKSKSTAKVWKLTSTRRKLRSVIKRRHAS